MIRSKTDEIVEFNRYYWVFIYLIINYPDIYLNEKGKIISEIVINNGVCRSITNVKRLLNIPKVRASRLCNELVKNDGHVLFNKVVNRKEIQFKKDVIIESMNIMEGILKNED